MNKNLVRINTRISKKANDWLDNESKDTGISKSSLVMLAIENYIREKEVINKLDDIKVIQEQLEKMQKNVK